MRLSVLGLFEGDLPLTKIANLLQLTEVTGIVLGLGTKRNRASVAGGVTGTGRRSGLTLSAEAW